MYGRVLGVAVVGVQGHLIRVQAHVGRGLPALPVAGLPGVVVPLANAAEASLVDGLEVIGAPTLAEVVAFLRGSWRPEGISPDRTPTGRVDGAAELDLADVRGQGMGRRALEVAAAGGHNALLIGPPGAGKTMLARRLPGLLPTLSFEEAVEATSIWSVAGRLNPGQGLLPSRPFRAPHHTISVAGLVGGGSPR